MTAAPRASKTRLALFVGGDFACNLYWQSVMLYLLFYYTEAIGLSMETASACYAAASVWDGVASLGIGLLVDRYARVGSYRLALIGGSIPLGLSFLLTYAPPPVSGLWMVVWVMAGHLLFRTFYALVNIPYLAMSARISADRRDRALVVGGRMIVGTLAAIVVALGTLPLGRLLTGSDGPRVYAAAAMLFALVATALLIAVGLTYRDDARPAPASDVSLSHAVRDIWRNPAFLVVGASMAAMIIAVTVLDKSVLYYFKYQLGNQAAGQHALGWMMAVGGIAIPAWLALSRIITLRALWLVAVGLCVSALLLFVLIDLRQILPVNLFLIVIQVASGGLNFALWALLPDVMDYRERRGGVRSEAALYGMVALAQRVAIGLGTGIFGLTLSQGEVGGESALRMTLAIIPLGFFLASAAIMLLDPMVSARSGNGISQD
ncbi:MAG: MFS transporter [Sphingopyxis sp.]